MLRLTITLGLIYLIIRLLKVGLLYIKLVSRKEKDMELSSYMDVIEDTPLLYILGNKSIKLIDVNKNRIHFSRTVLIMCTLVIFGFGLIISL